MAEESNNASDDALHCSFSGTWSIGDSLQAALSSLDNASCESSGTRNQGNLGSLIGAQPLSQSARRLRTSVSRLAAHSRQSQDLERNQYVTRPLVGGPTLAEMASHVRNKRDSADRTNRPRSSPRNSTLAQDADIVTPFDSFQNIYEEAIYEDEGFSRGADCNPTKHSNITADSRHTKSFVNGCNDSKHKSTSRDLHFREDQSAQGHPTQSKRRKTGLGLSWSERRDRRNARRRSSPPLTRGRAGNLGNVKDIATSIVKVTTKVSDHRDETSSSRTGASTSISITDPSLAEGEKEHICPERVRTDLSKPAPLLRRLDMTFTEADTPAESLTQEEISHNSGHSPRMPMSLTQSEGSPILTDSLTQEESLPHQEHRDTSNPSERRNNPRSSYGVQRARRREDLF